MARTAGECVAEARVLLQDTRAPHRYATQELLGYLTSAVTEAYRLRPDLFVGSYSTLPIFSESNQSAAVPLPVWLFPQAVNYMVGRAELRDDKFTVDGRALALTNAYATALLGRGTA